MDDTAKDTRPIVKITSNQELRVIILMLGLPGKAPPEIANSKAEISDCGTSIHLAEVIAEFWFLTAVNLRCKCCLPYSPVTRIGLP